MAIKAVIFDMDGVLIDAKEWHYDALNRALSMFGMEISRYDHLVTFDGLPTKEKLKMLSLERGLPPGLHDFVNMIKQKNTMQLIHGCCKPTFYHEYALAMLERDGYSLAVCSNSVRNSVDVMMQQAALQRYLKFSLSNEDVINAKPDPEIYLTAIEKLKLEPSECLVIEDNEKGIAAAKASGVHVLQVSGVEEVNYINIKDAISRVEVANA